LASEGRGGGLSPEARRIVEGLLAGRSLDELAPRDSALRGEVEAHLLESLEGAAREGGRPSRASKPSKPSKRAKPAPAAPPALTKTPVAYSDGASRGNPGPAAVGFVLRGRDGTELWSEGRRIGRATNNVAEYKGAIAALEKARELGLDEIELRMDSELVVKQLTGEYRVKDSALAVLKHEVDVLLRAFRSVRVRHVRREQNRDTDRLANEALDAASA
jgi:ribonuclease HI